MAFPMTPTPRPTIGPLTLHLVRKWVFEKNVVGQLFIDGVAKWFTLEDAWRPNQPKIPGQTCIPAGKYEIIINRSVRFNRMMPLLLNVPGFTGVRIHKGNTDQDTDGCILVGGSFNQNANTDFIGFSQAAFEGSPESVFPTIARVIANGFRVWIEVIDPDTKTGTEEPGEAAVPPGTRVA